MLFKFITQIHKSDMNHSSKIIIIIHFLFLFSQPLYCWIPCNRHYFLSYFFFKYFSLFKFIAQRQQRDMNNSFRIISIKISIIKVNIIRIYTNSTHFITWKCDITRILIKKEYIIIWKWSIIKFFNFLFVTNRLGTNFIVEENHQQLYHGFLESYIYQGNILA